MLPILHIAILALVQGITEFLPISSSGHLVLVPWALGWQDQGLMIDVAVHVGTLGAVMLYFKGDIFDMISGLWRMAKGRGYNNGARLAVYLVVATIPVVVAGFVVNKIFPDGIRSIMIIGWATLGFGLVLWFTDKYGLTLKRIEHLKFFDVIAIGISQVLALIPGTSRSGITMTAGRILGMERTDAARFSMLMSIPTIIGAGALKGYELFKIGDVSMISSAFIAAVLAFVSALVAIFLMMAWLRKATFTPFVIYRVVLGVFLLVVAYGYIG